MAEAEKPSRLTQEIFTYYVGKDSKVFIAWEGQQLTILKDKATAHFRTKIQDLSGEAAQLVMAKITGNFKRGNEHMA